MAGEAVAMETEVVGDDNSTQLSQGLEEIFNGGAAPFYKREIDLSSIFDEGQKKLKAKLDTVLDLSCLDELRHGDTASSSFFVPRNIYVRSEMQSIFPELLTKAHEAEVRKILTGSPGIGKSVIFFLAAFFCQLFHPNKKVAYLRKVDDEKELSFFLMEPGEQSHSVKVMYSREISKFDYQTLFHLWKELRSHTKVLKSNDYITFVNGPKHHETLDLLNKGYDFLCTSGGFPTKSQSEIMATDVRILSGWQENTLLNGLAALTELSQEEREAIYAVSGGRIRLALWGVKENGFERIKEFYNALITDLEQEKIELALTKTDSSASMSSSDRLRTRFLNYDGESTSLLIVDSFYAMTKLRGRLDFNNFMASYHLAGVCGLQSARGWFFEEIMHLWFKTANTPIITGWVRTKGAAADGVKELNKQNLYWIPSTSNFANIDAAVVHDSILVCLQYTIKKQHAFNKETFWADFASQVHATLPFTSVVIWFVVPQKTDFENTHEAYSQDLSAACTALRSQGKLPSVSVSFESAEVTCDSADTLNQTAPQLGFFG